MTKPLRVYDWDLEQPPCGDIHRSVDRDDPVGREPDEQDQQRAKEQRDARHRPRKRSKP